MKFALVICTFSRPKSIKLLIKSLMLQSVMPNQIIIVDSSFDQDTENIIKEFNHQKLQYFKVSDTDRGLTKQRNFGIKQAHEDIEIICFLDDDTVLDTHYFKALIDTYTIYDDAVGVGGYVSNEVKWNQINNKYKNSITNYQLDGYYRKEPLKFLVRKLLYLDSDLPPAYLPLYSYGRSVGFIPPSDKVYEVEQLIGCNFSFKKSIFDEIKFSTYFDGYGLYEDSEFCIRASKIGKLYINTKAKLEHHHDFSGRPNLFKFGRMVIENGWYLWRVKNPNPTVKHKFKWFLITLLHLIFRFLNIFTSNDRKNVIFDVFGRVYAWIKLFFIKPKKIE